jgi:hypothetical protein
LISPTYSSTAALGECFKFFYQLNGKSIGSLNIWLRQSGQLTKKLWEINPEKSGNLGKKWRLAQTTIKSDIDFEMVIEGTSKAKSLKNTKKEFYFF